MGSAGIEALLYEKSIITFGDTIYSVISSVSKVIDINDLPKMIQNSLKEKVDLKELNAFIQFIDKNSFDYDFIGMQKFIEDNILQGGFLDIEISNDKLNLLFENYKSTFEFVAQEFIKKINYFHEIDKK